MNEGHPLRVVQLTDLHFGAAPSPIDGRVPESCFTDVVEQLANHGTRPDLFVATGDLTDDGDARATARLQRALHDLGRPVYCLAGNHDRESTLPALRSEHVHAVRTSRHGNWLFCYLDTNATGRVRGADGTVTDHPDRVHAGASGSIDVEDLAVLDRVLATSDAPHAMVWLHHPPRPPAPPPPGSRWTSTAGASPRPATAPSRSMTTAAWNRARCWSSTSGTGPTYRCRSGWAEC